MFSRALYRMYVFASSFNWFIALFGFVVIGQKRLVTLENRSHKTYITRPMYIRKNHTPLSLSLDPLKQDWGIPGTELAELLRLSWTRNKKYKAKEN